MFPLYNQFIFLLARPSFFSILLTDSIAICFSSKVDDEKELSKMYLVGCLRWGQLGDLGVLNLKMPDKRFLYVYDHAIGRWNQIDPLHENANGYFAFGGNPVSFSDSCGLSVIDGKGDYWDIAGHSSNRYVLGELETRQVGSSGFTEASGAHFSSNNLLMKDDKNQEYINYPPPVQIALEQE